MHVSDEAVRGRVILPQSNWILRAPAGSGKTTLLVTRYLELLSRVEKPEEILAITFTRKATAEMRERILACLKSPDSAQPERLAEAARSARRKAIANRWEVVANPSRLKIQTIESFRRSLVEASPVEAQIAPGTELVENSHHFYEEAVERVLARLARGESHTAPVARLLALEQFNVGRVKRALVTLLAKRDQWRPAHEGSSAHPPQWLIEKMQRLHAMLEEHLSPTDMAVLASTWTQCAGEDPWLIPRHWRRVANLCLTGTGTLRKRLPKDVHPAQAPVLRQLLDSLRDTDANALKTARLLPDIKPNAREESRVKAIEASLALVQGALSELFAERGCIDLVELGFGATRSLGSDELPTDLIIALDYSIKHVLVDEFQDTSVTQADFLHSLIREWMPGEDRSLFAVGDPMQSIYGFREAEVGLFYLAEREGVGRPIDAHHRTIALSAAKLETNFRSHPSLIEWVNQAFSPATDGGTDLATGRVAFEPAVPAQGQDDKSTHLGAELHLFQSPGQGQAELKQESKFIADTARSLLKAERQDQVAILLRNRTQAPILLSAIRDAGLEYQGTELDRLADEPAVRDMLTLARAIAAPRDRLANFSLLRSPAIGLSLAALHRLARRLDAGSPLISALTEERFTSTLSEAERVALERCLPRLQAFRAQYQKQPPRPLLERAWITTGLDAAHGDRRAQKSLEALLALIESQGINWIDFEALQRVMGNLYAPSISDSRLIVMTIHQAKGLEFDHVLVPFTSRSAKADEKPSMRWRHTPEGLLAATRHDSKRDGSLYDWLEHEHKARMLAECERVLYVAVTRARKSLHLTATLGQDAISISQDKPTLTDSAAPRPDTLLAPIWHATRQQARLHPAKVVKPSTGEPAARTATLERLPQGWRWQPKTRLTRIELDSAFRLMTDDDRTSATRHSEPWTPQAPIMVGNVVHEALRWLSEQASDASPQARIDALRPLLRRWLMRDAVGHRGLERMQAQVIRHLTRALAHRDGRWLLAPRASARSEASFAAFVDGRLLHLQVDRTFVEDGTRYIIDYKTARPRAKESRTAFRARQLKEHEAQLARYARIFTEIETLPVVAALFLTSTPELVRVPLDTPRRP